MNVPPGLRSLLDYGVITNVVRPLLSGKEAQVYLVISDGEERVAKVYKEAMQRSFKHRAVYAEGRTVRNSRDRRAMAKRTKHGREQDEAAWRSAEVDMIYRLRGAGVRVPTPYTFLDGVLVMELIKDAHGEPAPRLCEVDLTPAQAEEVFDILLREVVKMLCADVVHGDLSDFNVLMSATGPVVIDFPQALDAAGNQAAAKILSRDVANLNRFLQGFGRTSRPLQHAQEMWALYTASKLAPDTELTGRHKPNERMVDMRALREEMKRAKAEQARIRAASA